MNIGAKLGSLISFILFLLFGLVPALLYGGYMGLIMAATLFGPITTTGLFTQLIVAGGMCLGVSATLSLFLVTGGLGGAAIQTLVLSRAKKSEPLTEEALLYP